ncbi:MAG: hypothetical protein MZV65_51570 [Chromatiales bacterium]|nr:hypothetical protein [Chromatiales bacterium]
MFDKNHIANHKFMALHSQLTQIDWNEDSVLYCAISGETHFLNKAGSMILNRIKASPVLLEDLEILLRNAGFKESHTNSISQFVLRVC